MLLGSLFSKRAALLAIIAASLFSTADARASVLLPETGLGPVSAEPSPSEITAARSSLALPEGARLVAETARFRLVATSRTEGLARALSGEVEELRDRIAADLGRDYDGVTEVRIAGRSSSFQALQPEQGAPSWAVGVAWPGLNLIVINAGHGRSPSEIRRTLAHEVSHIALGRLAPRRYPRWFLEGMATYHSEDWSFTRAGSLAGAVLREGLIPLKDLHSAWPDTPAEVRLAYAESNDFVAWLFRNHGRDSIHSLMAEVVSGVPFEDAIEIGTGLPMWELEYEWKAGLPLRYTWLPAITSGTFLWGFMSLLFILAYLRKRHSKRRRLAAMEEEEAWIFEPDDEDDTAPEETPRPSNINGSGKDPGTDASW